MGKENQNQSDSQTSNKPKSSRKKKLLLFLLLVFVALYGAFAYINRSPDPTTWESLRHNYKNTK